MPTRRQVNAFLQELLVWSIPLGFIAALIYRILWPEAFRGWRPH